MQENLILECPNGKIYKVTDNEGNLCYYGSTESTLKLRMGRHRRSYTSYLKGNSNYITVFSIFDKYGVDNCKIELVKLFPCASTNILRAEEGIYIKDNECVNKIIIGRTKREYCIDNKDRITEKHNEWLQNNKERVQEKHNEWKELNKEHLKEYEKVRHKKRMTDNPQYYKDYYEKNKEKYQARQIARKKIFVHCDICDCDLSQKAYICHTRTPKHLNNILIKNI